MIFDNIFAVALKKAKRRIQKNIEKILKKDVDIRETLWYHLKRCLQKKATKIIEKNSKKLLTLTSHGDIISNVVLKKQ